MKLPNLMKNEDIFIPFFFELRMYECKQGTHIRTFSLCCFTRYILVGQIKQISQEHDTPSGIRKKEKKKVLRAHVFVLKG